MLEQHSPLGGDARFETTGLTMREAGGFSLTQYAGTERTLFRELGVEAAFGKNEKSDGSTFLRISENQIWVIGKELETRQSLVTPLSSSRCRIALFGEKARMVLASCAAVDFSRANFGTGAYVMTGIHHTPVLIHCTGPESFHIYALRTFALSVWDWLVDAASGL